MKHHNKLLLLQSTRLPLLSFLLAMLPMTISAQSTNITFADATVKAICVTNWDTNGDGELSYDEAAAVTDLGQTFSGNYDITSFNELQYFTGLTIIGEGTFSLCFSLTSIIIPSSVSSISEWAFVWCSRLMSIAVDGGNNTYDSRNNCNAIIETATNTLIFGCQSTVIPSNVTTIGSYAFNAARNMTNITIPSSVTTIGEYNQEIKGETNVEIIPVSA